MIFKIMKEKFVCKIRVKKWIFSMYYKEYKIWKENVRLKNLFNQTWLN